MDLWSAVAACIACGLLGYIIGTAVSNVAIKQLRQQAARLKKANWRLQEILWERTKQNDREENNVAC